MSDTSNDFNEEIVIKFKNEVYSTRDNGAILRHKRKEGRNRKLDEKWTFGKVNAQKGYLEIGGVGIHRIIATAFHGVPPTPQHVVDHIDTNRQNNKPSNLRWVTRFENIMLNPITRKKIETICNCSIDEVLKDISILQNINLPRNYEWMRSVSEEEAQNSLVRLNKWAKKESTSKVGVPLWEDTIRKSKTYLAAQKNWYLAGHFPCCPIRKDQNTLQDYLNNLNEGSILFQRDEEVITVIEARINTKEEVLNIKCNREGTVKKFCLISVDIQNGWFVHSISAYFDQMALEKYFTLAMGLEWTGGKVFDDFC